MDEIDSIGSSRLESGSGGDSEVQRTMLELLNQLDGFEATKNIKVIMATNRIDILDSALLRPGNFSHKWSSVEQNLWQRYCDNSPLAVQYWWPLTNDLSMTHDRMHTLCGWLSALGDNKTSVLSFVKSYFYRCHFSLLIEWLIVLFSFSQYDSFSSPILFIFQVESTERSSFRLPTKKLELTSSRFIPGKWIWRAESTCASSLKWCQEPRVTRLLMSIHGKERSTWSNLLTGLIYNSRIYLNIRVHKCV